MCTFTVAVNRRRKIEGQPDADFFRVSAWRGLGDSCARYLTKGKKVCVVGEVSARTYEAKDGSGSRASLEINAHEVEFVSAREQGEGQAQHTPAAIPEQGEARDGAWTEITDGDLPF